MQAPLGHHLDEVTVAQALSDVPAHTEYDNLAVDLTFYRHRVPVLALCDHVLLSQELSLADNRRCTRTLRTISGGEQTNDVVQIAGIQVGDGPELHAVAGPVRDIESLAHGERDVLRRIA